MTVFCFLMQQVLMAGDPIEADSLSPRQPETAPSASSESTPDKPAKEGLPTSQDFLADDGALKAAPLDDDGEISTADDPAWVNDIQMVLAENTTYTKSRNVAVRFEGVNAGVTGLEMSYAINGTTEDKYTEWVTFSSVTTVQLSSWQGANWVTFRFRDADGNMSWRWDSIVLDSVKPTVSMTLNGGVAVSESRDVALHLDASDSGSGIARYRYAINGSDPSKYTAWMDFQADSQIRLPNWKGTNWVMVEVQDHAGNSRWAWGTVNYQPVTQFIKLNNGAENTVSRDIEVALVGDFGNEAGLEISYAVNSTAENSFSTWEPFSRNLTVQLANLPGNQYVNVRVRDAQGKIRLLWSKINYQRFLINGGDAFTRDHEVTVSIHLGSQRRLGTQMRFAVNSTDPASFSAWQPYTDKKTLRLPGYDGLNFVNAEFRSATGEVYRTLFDSILFDRTKPEISVTVNGGQQYTSNREVNLSISLFDEHTGGGKLSYAVGNISESAFSPWETVEAAAGTTVNLTRTVNLPDYNGTLFVAARYLDHAGNIRYAYASIKLDRVAPTGSILINSGASETSSRDVTLTLTGADTHSGVHAMSFLIDGVVYVDSGIWRQFETTAFLSLPDEVGEHTITVRIRDRAGNISQYSASITLNPIQAEPYRDYELEFYVQEQPPAENQPNSFFGEVMSSQGNRLLTGAREGDDGKGAAYLIDVNAASQNYGNIQHTFANPFPGRSNNFGADVALTGKVAIIGAPADQGSGKIYIFDADPLSPDFGDLVLTINNPDAYSDTNNTGYYAFGERFELTGNLLAISAVRGDSPPDGNREILLYNIDPTAANFGNVVTVIQSPTGSTAAGFGNDLSGKEGMLAVGAGAEDSEGSNTGRVYLFDTNPESPTFADRLLTFENPTPQVHEFFGSNVKISGNYLAISAPNDHSAITNGGAVYVYSIEPAGISFGKSLGSYFNPDENGNVGFGTAIAFHGTNLFVGAYQTSIFGALRSGVVYAYDLNTANATFGNYLQTIECPFPSFGDYFGQYMTGGESGFFVGAVWEKASIGSDNDPKIFYFTPQAE